MKTKRTFFAIIIAIAMALAALSGCSETGNEEINSFQSDTSEEDSTEVREYGHAMKWVEIPVDDEQDFEDEIIDIIDEFQDMNEHDEEYDLYSHNEIDNISEFYCLDDLEIEGFKLYSSFITPAIFIYNFSLVDSTINDGSICIDILRPEQFPGVDLFEEAVEEFQEKGQGHVTEDDMLYIEEAGLLIARLNDTILEIQTTTQLRNYEFMRDIALQIIETATPVDVEQELEQRGRGRNKNQSRRRNQGSDS